LVAARRRHGMGMASLATLAGLVSLTLTVAAAPRRPGAHSLVWEGDLDGDYESLAEFHCGKLPASPQVGTPSVLLLGDSVSCINNGLMEERQIFEVDGIMREHVGGCRDDDSINWTAIDWVQGNTDFAMNCTDPSTPDNWLSFDGTYDVIHFNFGLHDVEISHPYIPTIGPSQHVDIDTYGTNIRTIYERLAARARVVQWATITPAPRVNFDTCKLCRHNSDVNDYNARAREVLGGDASVDDLNWLVNNHCGGSDFESCDWQQPFDVHFTDDGTTEVINAIYGSVMGPLRELYPQLVKNSSGPVSLV
jgi:hypothetical protein